MENGNQTTFRRPVPARKLGASKRLTLWLVSTGITPNTISVLGMVAGILAGVAFAVTTIQGFERIAFLIAAVLMPLRLIANMMDGMVAVETGTESPVGELFNDIPDRVSDVAMFIGAGYAVGGNPALGYIAACLAVFIAYVRVEGKVAGAKMDYCGPLAKPARVYAMIAIAFYCFAAPTAWQPAFDSLPGWGLVAFGLSVIIIGEIWTALRRILRIASDLRGSVK